MQCSAVQGASLQVPFHFRLVPLVTATATATATACGCGRTYPRVFVSIARRRLPFLKLVLPASFSTSFSFFFLLSSSSPLPDNSFFSFSITSTVNQADPDVSVPEWRARTHDVELAVTILFQDIWLPSLGGSTRLRSQRGPYTSRRYDNSYEHRLYATQLLQSPETIPTIRLLPKRA